MGSQKRQRREADLEQHSITETKRPRRMEETADVQQCQLTFKEQTNEESDHTFQPHQGINNQTENKVSIMMNGYQIYEGFNQYLKALHMDRLKRIRGNDVQDNLSGNDSFKE
eukprot:TRINITY_DN37246_c0_g1_i3.p3 TRINITY_DN37246_c0_g1~~TRINITY_DN37246_c0_g1_i3.p3  ORF type:complete len:112 (-),score=3.58 TRINITY_DN37246_c0_g1_i3:616-951(-)